MQVKWTNFISISLRAGDTFNHPSISHLQTNWSSIVTTGFIFMSFFFLVALFPGPWDLKDAVFTQLCQQAFRDKASPFVYSLSHGLCSMFTEKTLEVSSCGSLLQARILSVFYTAVC